MAISQDLLWTKTCMHQKCFQQMAWRCLKWFKWNMVAYVLADRLYSDHLRICDGHKTTLTKFALPNAAHWISLKNSKIVSQFYSLQDVGKINFNVKEIVVKWNLAISSILMSLKPKKTTDLVRSACMQVVFAF